LVLLGGPRNLWFGVMSGRVIGSRFKTDATIQSSGKRHSFIACKA
jgi:hypothetical protein